MPANNHNELKIVYERICQSHDGIADFRARLLALLPLASGAGIFLLVGGQGPANDILPHLLPIGLFGSLVTIGLFFYELRGIQKCRGLIACAQRLEKALLTDGFGEYGAFQFRQKSALGGMVGAVGAALAIYPAVIGAWMYVASIGLAKSLAFNDTIIWLPLTAVILSSLFGLTMNRWQKQQLKQRLAALEQDERPARSINEPVG